MAADVIVGRRGNQNPDLRLMREQARPMPASLTTNMMVVIVVMMATTSVPVKPGMLRRLRSYTVGGTTYGEVLNDLMDDNPPGAFIREHLRRLREEPDIPWSEVRKRLRL